MLDGRDPTVSKCVTEPTATSANGKAVAAQCCTAEDVCVRTTTGGRSGCISGKFHRSNANISMFFETTWSQAAAMCDSLGLTLCDQNCQGTGCSYDHFWVWTNLTCPSPPSPPALPPAAPPVPPTTPPPVCDLAPLNVSEGAINYFVYSSQKTWPDARDYCNACHSSLAKVSSAAEDLALVQVAATLPSGVEGVWLSGTTLIDAGTYLIDHRHDYGESLDPTDLGNWYWYPDGATTFNASDTYTNWGHRPVEPNNGAGGNGEYCLVIYTVPRPNYLKWVNVLCTRTAAFACM